MIDLWFDRPLALLLAPIATSGLAYIYYRARERVVSLARALGPPKRGPAWKLFTASVVARALLVLLISLLLARPYVTRTSSVELTPDSPLLSRAEAEIVILIDASKSMSYELGLSPGRRIDATLSVVGELLRELGPNDTVALVAFAGNVETIYEGPPEGALEALAAIEANRSYTSIGDALVYTLARYRASTKPAAVILLSDGGNNGGSDPLESASLLRDAGLPLLAVQVGSGASADPRLMERVAEEAGGEFRVLGELDPSVASSLAGELAREAKYGALEAAGRLHVEVEVRDYEGPRNVISILAAVALAIALAGGA